jgi:SAM-dependent methyltransferase
MTQQKQKIHITLPPEIIHLRAHTLGRYKRQAYLDLIRDWCGSIAGKHILKTDLHEEAYGSDMFLFDLITADNCVCAVDLSRDTTKRAQDRAHACGVSAENFVTADVRSLPYPTDFFDIIISSSTLDHFPESDLRLSLHELKRVLKPGGMMLLAVHNQHNVKWQLGRFLRLVPDDIELYTLPQINQVAQDCGFTVRSDRAIVHTPSALNTVLLFLRPLLGLKITAAIAQRGIAAFTRAAKDPHGYSTASYIALRLTN